jgi:hypothetical protein
VRFTRELDAFSATADVIHGGHSGPGSTVMLRPEDLTFG